jgi:hypothetical protein
MKNERRRRVCGSLAACAMLLVLAAAKTKTAESTGGEPTTGGRVHKVLVLVLAPDPSTRASVEDVIAGELSLRGANTTASHLLFPELPKDRPSFEEKVVAGGFDGVTVSRLVARDDKAEWHEGGVSFQTNYMGMDYWGGYWYTFQQVQIPGYLAKETKVRVRTDLWRVAGSKGSLAWSGTSDLVDPVTLPQASREIGAGVAKALLKAKLI